MEKVKMKQILPLIFAGIALVFAYIGFTNLGFWHSVDGPQAGFFPSIMAIIMFFTSILAFIQSFKENSSVKYHKEEMMVIISVILIMAGTFIIGLLPSCCLYIITWLRYFEKSTWKSTLTVTAVIMIIIVGVFQIWLGIQFPLGLFEGLV